MTTHKTLAAGLLIAEVASACGGATPAEAPPSAAPTPAPTQASAPETPTQAATSGSVRISTDILKACGLPDADSYFSFDSAQLEKRDISPLNAITTCFTTGPLKGHSMKLVGRADPRGASDYNMTLGQSRADAVEKYLGNKGLQKGKVESTSRGAMDATGTDESGWNRDRRVDILLGD
jgi:peptidoglycan-associated lipoprotein